MNKLKTFFIIYLSCTVFFFLAFSMSVYQKEDKLFVFYISAMFAVLGTGFFYLTNLYKILLDYFDNKTYAEQDEIHFQTNLRREIERKRALSQVDNENLHYQNQLRIEAIAQIAHIHLQSNQYLANLYQQAIINNSRNQENAAADTLQELEQELKRQGLI